MPRALEVFTSLWDGAPANACGDIAPDAIPVSMTFTGEALDVAFQLHIVNLLVRADLVVGEREQALLARYFPPAFLREHGFLDAEGRRTPHLEHAIAAALDVLPRDRTVPERLALLDDCFRIAAADGEIPIGEGAILLMAARLLGLSDEAFDAFVAERPGGAGLSAALLDG